MNYRKLLIVLPALLILAGCDSDYGSSDSFDSSTSFVGDPDDDVITIFSINDFHGKIENTSTYNGIIALQGAIRSNEYYESSSLILSSGDMWQGSYISGYDDGLSTTELMNSFSFDAMALGNHEFDWGVDVIRTNGETADFPFLCANLIDEETGSRPDFVSDHTVVEAEGHKIGVVGAIGTGLESDIASEMIEGYHFSSDLSLLEDAYDACIAEGAEAVVLSLHDDQNSYYTDSIQDSDIPFVGIFGGHSHSFQNEIDDGIPYVQAGCDGDGYSYMVIDLEDNSVQRIRYEEIDDSLASYADESFIEEVEALIESRPAEAIGYLQGDWDKNSSGNLVVRAMFEMARELRPDAQYDETNLVSYHNSGGIRGSYPSSDEPLLVTMADIQIVSPFDNEVVLLPDRTISSSGLSGVTYPESVWQMNGEVADIVTINYVLNDTAGMLSSEGAEPLKGVGEDPYYIYDVVADYIRNNSSEDDPLRAEDFV